MQLLEQDILPIQTPTRHFLQRPIGSRANQIRLPGIDRPIAHSSIIRLMGFGNYTWVYLAEPAKPVLITQTLKWFENQLADFVRVHKSEMINPLFVQSITNPNNATLEVCLTNGYIARISRRRIQGVINKLALANRPFNPQ
ncbi:LytTR family DNA-binding domain-containing protein [Spirosoma panaciterrae]|uniref:LytTR family DNA-binding domain-containing protein n=1 Tax=Spirosoma panaciterrae TaxID=496058 RepID=UPI000A04D0DA|nr:LytTR family DNA-binding domain-containing protein [Spirosoma panaciterrae]